MINYQNINLKRMLNRVFLIGSIFLATLLIVSCNSRKVTEKKAPIAVRSRSFLTPTVKASDSLECKPTVANAVVSLGRDITPVWTQTNKIDRSIFSDAPIRAYRLNAKTCIHITSSTGVRLCGESLVNLNSSAEVIFRSPENKAFQEFDYHNWLFSPYALDNNTLIALAHSEWYDCLKYPEESPKYCKKNRNKRNSWVNAVTLYQSNNGGATWSRIGIVERPEFYPKTFEPIWAQGKNSNFGFFHPSNIIREGNKYYAFAHHSERDVAGNLTKTGMILLSTMNPLSPNWEQLTQQGKFIRQSYTGRILPGTSGWTQVNMTWNTAMCQYLILFWDANKARLMSTTTASLAKPVFTTPLEVKNQDDIQIPENTEIGLHGYNYPVSQLDPDSLSNNFETSDDSFFIFMNSFTRKNATNRSIYRVTARLINQ